MKAVALAAAVVISASSLVVVGTADLPRPIDYVEVDFVIQATEKSATAAIEALRKKAKAVEKTLQKYVQNVEEDIDISQPQISANEDGFTAYAIIQADISDPSELGKAIDAAFKKGASGIEEIEYQTDEANEDKLLKELVESAIKDAKSKAEDYAQALGVELGQLAAYAIQDQEDFFEVADSDIGVQVYVEYWLGEQEENEEDEDEEEQNEEEKEEDQKEEEEDDQEEEEQQQNQDQQEAQQRSKKQKGKKQTAPQSKGRR